ncbi:hypothetical protein BH09SUM1_BH09SUM1_14900 [soil metagenome]
MKRFLLPAIAALVIGGYAIAQDAKPAASPKPSAAKPSVQDYSLIWRRNIFDPDRSPRVIRRSTGPSGPVEPVDDKMRLAGSIVVPGGGTAFISEGGLRGVKSLHAGEKIEGLTILKIGTEQVIARQGDQDISWPVGVEILRTGKEPWRVPRKQSEDEIIERLRKRRLQEMKDEK